MCNEIIQIFNVYPYFQATYFTWQRLIYKTLYYNKKVSIILNWFVKFNDCLHFWKTVTWLGMVVVWQVISVSNELIGDLCCSYFEVGISSLYVCSSPVCVSVQPNNENSHINILLKDNRTTRAKLAHFCHKYKVNTTKMVHLCVSWVL